MAGFVKNFNVTFDYALNEVAFVNLILYTRTLPSYDFDKDKKNGHNAAKKATTSEWNAGLDKMINKHGK